MRKQQRAQERAEEAKLEMKDQTDKMPTTRRGRFFEWIKENSSFTDWCIALFTDVLAGAAIYQFLNMNGQLDDMRKDRRPWITISFKAGDLQPNNPISLALTRLQQGN
jgi:hypothetical protein